MTWQMIGTSERSTSIGGGGGGGGGEKSEESEKRVKAVELVCDVIRSSRSRPHSIHIDGFKKKFEVTHHYKNLTFHLGNKNYI